MHWTNAFSYKNVQRDLHNDKREKYFQNFQDQR